MEQGPQLQPRNWLADRAREYGLYGLSNRLNDPTSGAGIVADGVGGLLNMLVVEPYQSMNRMLERPMVSGDPRNAEDAFNVAGAAMVGSIAAPRPRNALGAGGNPTQPKGITAYHGSPHDFDRFDMSKIGTGEGAQAYGHGLYFAENEGVARSYRDKLGGLRSGFEINGRSYDPIGGNKEIKRLASAEKLDSAVAREVLAYHDKTPEEMIAEVTRWPSGERDANILAAAEWKRQNHPKVGGRMYEVRINADPNDFLDWDKPLSQQSEKVRSTIEPALKKAAEDMGKGASPEKIAQFKAMGLANIAERMQPKNIDPWSLNVVDVARQYPNALREAGIPGIKYLDQGSRTAGEGSRNYVVFDDSLVEIMRKYGLAGLLASGGAVNNLLAGYGYPQPAQPQQHPDWTRNVRPGDI